MAEHHSRFRLLSQMFPYQTRSIPTIIIWTLIFIADVALVFWAAHLLGFSILNAVNNKGLLILYLLLAFALFCIESFLYNLIKG